MINIPAQSVEEFNELKVLLKYTSRLDEKRIAVRQLIDEGSVLLNNAEFDLIAYPLFSGLIPASLLNLLNIKIKNKGLPFFEYSAPSSLGTGLYAQSKGNFEIEFKSLGDLLIDKIAEDFLAFVKQNSIDLSSARILLVDANIAKGLTIKFFIKALEKVNYSFKNLTCVVTDNKIENLDAQNISAKLLNDGNIITFNKTNRTNKVFDNVLNPSCQKRDANIKKFVGSSVIFDFSQVTFMPYYLAIKIFDDECNKVAEV